MLEARSSLEIAPSAAGMQDAETTEYQVTCCLYRQGDDLLSLIIQINQLIKVVQKHRGASMGVLAGDESFTKDLATLQQHMARRLAMLECFARSTGGLLSDRDKQNLHLAWATIRHDWQDDNVSDNFELHTHLIEQLQVMLVSLAKKLEQPFSADPEAGEALAGGDTAYPKHFKKIEMLNFIARQLPDMIEQLAKVRGLSVYAASIGSVDFYNDRKLRFLLQCTREQSDKLRGQAERINEQLAGGFSALQAFKNIELKLLYLLNTVEQDVLSGLDISTGSQQYFTLATEIIDVYWKVVSDGLLQVRQWQQEDLDDWLRL